MNGKCQALIVRFNFSTAVLSAKLIISPASCANFCEGFPRDFTRNTTLTHHSTSPNPPSHPQRRSLLEYPYVLLLPTTSLGMQCYTLTLIITRGLYL